VCVRGVWVRLKTAWAGGHSGQLILRPYGWTNADSPDEAVHRTLGAAMAAAIAGVSSEAYTSQKSIALYATSGSASDWYRASSHPCT
jgi:hypothetical protein